MRRRLHHPRHSDLFNAPDLVNFRRYKIISALHETDLRSRSRNGSMYSSFSDLDEGLYALSDQGSTINEEPNTIGPVNESVYSSATELDDSPLDTEIKADGFQ